MVGEHGRELVKLPGGTRVMNNSKTESMMRSAGQGGGAVVIEIRSGGARLDDVLVDLLRRSIKAKGGNVQVVLGA
jgi:hypothetical protein